MSLAWSPSSSNRVLPFFETTCSNAAAPFLRLQVHTQFEFETAAFRLAPDFSEL